MKNYIAFDSQRLVTAFYHDAVHGPRRLLVPDPTHEPRQIEVILDNGEIATANDPTDVAPLIDGGPNPATLVPVDAVEITDDQYRDLLDNAGRRRVTVDAGVVTLSAYTPPLPPLADVQAAAAAAIDAAAGVARARYITIAPGQEATYQLKADQATAYRDAGYPADATPWPLINLEAAATGATPRATADLVLATRDAWIGIAARIEAARIGGKLAVLDSVDAATVGIVRTGALTALESI